jgi:peptide deformylase
MTEIITNLDDLRYASEPLKFISEEGLDKTEGENIINQLHEVMDADKTILTLAAPQLGFNKRIFCIRFEDTIKTFIDPIITKKAEYKIAPETCVSMPGKEILISRPEDITVVYYTADFKYEENKLLGSAARLFDQQAQLLDGVLPDDLGLVSDVEIDGSLADLSEEEIVELVSFYKEYVKVKTEAAQKAIKEDVELQESYTKMSFAEKVVNGKAAVIADEQGIHEMQQRAKAKAALKIKKIDDVEKANNKNQLKQFLNRKGKR